MKNRSLKFKLWSIAILSSVGMMILGSVGIYSSNRLTGDLKEVVFESLPIIRNLTLIDMVHDGVRGYVIEANLAALTKDKARIENAQKEINEHSESVEKYFSEIEKHTISKELSAKVVIARAGMKKYIDAANHFITVALDKESTKVEETYKEFQEQFEALEKSLADLGEFAQAESKQSFDSKLTFGNTMKWFSIALCGFMAFFSTLISVIVSTRLVKQLMTINADVGESSGSVGASASQVSSASQNVMSAVQQQAAAIQQTSSALEEISAMVARSSERSTEVSTFSERSKESAKNGKNIVDQLTQAISKLKESNENSAQELSQSNNKVGHILKVIEEVTQKTKVINDIVFQTKLLSFNASVEAARAGEHGKGFAVVAEEVGNLAQMSGAAAREINALLDSSLLQVNQTIDENGKCVEKMVTISTQLLSEGVAITEQCQNALNEILQSSTQVSEMIQDIASGSSESSKGVTEITQAINEINTSSKLTADAANASFNSAQALTNEVDRLRKSGSELSQIVQGKVWINEFKWKDDYFLHVDAMDAEHQILIAKINQLAGSFNSGNMNQIKESFFDLASYTQEHFSDEENYMKQIGYPDFDNHKGIHTRLLNQITEFKDKLESDSLHTDELMNFLNDWLVKHILGVDMKYAFFSRSENASDSKVHSNIHPLHKKRPHSKEKVA